MWLPKLIHLNCETGSSPQWKMTMRKILGCDITSRNSWGNVSKKHQENTIMDKAVLNFIEEADSNSLFRTIK